MKNKINFKINKMKFYWRLTDKTDLTHTEIPNFLPFELSFNDKFDLIIQKRTSKLSMALNLAYQEEWNIGNIQEINNLSIGYVKDFLSFIEKGISRTKTPVKSVLEIGCGGCVVLEKLKKRFKVLGIDPSPYSRKEGNKRGIRVIEDFFPSKQIEDHFDLIYHSDVIEHVNNPVKFLRDQYELLNKNGIIIFATPDCTNNIANGDSSIFLHQHLSYFDKDSLRNVVKAAGFTNILIAKAKYGGSLYCCAKKSTRLVKYSPVSKDTDKFNDFVKKNKNLQKKIENYFVDKKSDTVGIYAPIRFLPYLAKLNIYGKLRFFDDTNFWHKKYLDGLPFPIENFHDLIKNPVKNILIMSPTFGNVIEKKISKEFKGKISITKLTDFFEL